VSASPEMVALVDAYLRVAIDSGPASARTKATLLAAIAEIEAARDEATRRLAVLVGAINSIRAVTLGGCHGRNGALDALATIRETCNAALTAALPPATSGEERT